MKTYEKDRQTARVKGDTRGHVTINLVLHAIGKKNGASFLDQSLSEIKQNRKNSKILSIFY